MNALGRIAQPLRIPEVFWRSDSPVTGLSGDVRNDPSMVWEVPVVYSPGRVVSQMRGTPVHAAVEKLGKRFQLPPISENFLRECE
ncbi:MAG: hypothetical protein KGQ60_10250 [Planctomycetes bacterium]|nr:hypothetical protein [Planctomycetota bacterium]